MDLINDLEADLAFAFVLDQRFRKKIDSARAIALIDRVRDLLESSAAPDISSKHDENGGDLRSFSVTN